MFRGCDQTPIGTYHEPLSMKHIVILSLFILTEVGLAQQSYFTPENKEEAFKYYKDKLYRGCSELKVKQDPVPQEELLLLTNYSKKLIEKHFARAFEENPKVRSAFHKDVEALLRDASCRLSGNHCRARLLALSLFYIQTFRIDLPQCHSFKPTSGIPLPPDCEVEAKFRTRDLTSIHGSNYGQPGPATYKKQLIKYKNDLAADLFTLVMQKDKKTIYICNSAQSDLVHRYALELDAPGGYFVGLDPEYDPEKNSPSECKEDNTTLSGEFIRGNFDQDRSTVGQDQVEPLRIKISQYLRSHPDEVITEVIVTASSSKTPYYTTVAGKKIIDPRSDILNLQMATERAKFAKKLLDEVQVSNSAYRKIVFTARAELTGPDFSSSDLNDRFVTKMSPDYIERVDSFYRKNEKLFKEKVFMTSTADLFNENEFVNFYQVKFKPFHGLSLVFRGHKREESRCSDLSFQNTPRKNKTSKQ
jgi:hypothetical protein